MKFWIKYFGVMILFFALTLLALPWVVGGFFRYIDWVRSVVQ